MSALAFSVITGTLESIVEATPQRQGRGHLRQMYNALHGIPVWRPQEDEGNPLEKSMGLPLTSTLAEVQLAQGQLPPHVKYYRKIVLPEAVYEELEWWQNLLKSDRMCRSAFGPAGHVLSDTWGDGSGTGTGGTINVKDLEVLQWMGAWLPDALPRTSNWKELHTLLLTLIQTAHFDTNW